MNNKQTQLVYGTLLGDAHMRHGGRCIHPRLTIRHCLKQQELVFAKYEIMKEFVGTPPKTVVNGGWGNYLVAFNTLSRAEFTPIYEICYPGRKKKVTEEWLYNVNEEGLAWWFMDDGSQAKAGVQISSEGFSMEEHETITKWFMDRWGIDAKIRTSSKRDLVHLGFNKEAGTKLSQLIAPFVIPSMKYKLYTPIVRKCENCGEEFFANDGKGPQTYCMKAECRTAMSKKNSRAYYLTNRDRIMKSARLYRLQLKAKKKMSMI